MTEKFAKVNNINICYEIFGEENDTAVFLVHGFGSKKEGWIAQAKALSEKFKVIRFDNRGAGKSDRPNEPVTLKMFADDIAGLMTFLNIDEAHIIGWSLGGMIVQHFLLHHQNRIKNAVLLHTNYKGTGIEYYKEIRHKQLDILLKDPEKAFWESARTGYYREFRKKMEKNPLMKFHGLWSAEDLIKQNAIDPPTHQDIDNQAGAIAEHNTLADLNQITVPILLVAASHDRLCPKSTMLEMDKRLPNSTFKTIEKAGHSAPLSQAPEVNKIILDFLTL